MIRWTTPVSRKRITYQTERVGTTKIRRVIVHKTFYTLSFSQYAFRIKLSYFTKGSNNNNNNNNNFVLTNNSDHADYISSHFPLYSVKYCSLRYFKSLISISMVASLQNDLFLSDLPTKIVCISLLSDACHISCPLHSPLLYSIWKNTFTKLQLSNFLLPH